MYVYFAVGFTSAEINAKKNLQCQKEVPFYISPWIWISRRPKKANDQNDFFFDLVLLLLTWT